MPERHPLLCFLALTFGLAWGLAGAFWLLVGLGYGFLAEGQPGMVGQALFLAAVWAPTSSALIVTWLAEGRPGLGRLLSRLSPRRAGTAWWAAAVVLPLGLMGIAVAIAAGISEIHPARLLPESLGGLLTVLGLSLISGPLGEELGWRGFALPRLVRRMTPLAAALVIGGIWALWHLPVLVVPEIKQAFLPPGFPTLAFPVYVLANSVLIAWLVLRGGGCVWLAVLPHLALLWAVGAISRDPQPALIWSGAGVFAAAAMLVAATPRMRRRAGPESSGPAAPASPGGFEARMPSPAHRRR